MPENNCCVKNCSNASHDCRGNHKNNGLQFFRFPKWRTRSGEQVSDITRRRRMSWVAAIRRKDLTFDHIPQSMRVCSLHFHSGKPSYEMLENHPDWTPSLRLGHSEVKPTDGARYQRQHDPAPGACATAGRASGAAATIPGTGAVAAIPGTGAAATIPNTGAAAAIPGTGPAASIPRTGAAAAILGTGPAASIPGTGAAATIPGTGAAATIPGTGAAAAIPGTGPGIRDVINSLLEENRKLKEELDEYRMNENFLSGDDNTVKYYTGLPSFVMFQTLLCSLMPYPFQLVLLILMRLRLDLPVQHLSCLFRVHRTTVSDDFHHTLGVISRG
ncbi:hypothetical protein N1851_007669 [Merluccius polli]|uniref:THAP-type domain-containing protein n=1 Tax=Merluccius polli TaxID=89951 RepID=A0AA47N3G7_MERPO|nr:hypothetical protein N1851_007669 [Merluccius polli]